MNKNEEEIIMNCLEIIKNYNLFFINYKELEKSISKENFENYLNNYLLKKLNKDLLSILKQSIRKYNNDSFEPFVINEKNNLKIFIPEIKTIKEALINIHEITHAISILNGNVPDYYSEIIPFNEERLFLDYYDIDFNYEFYRLNQIINSINFAEDYLSHVYASLIILNHPKIKKELTFSSNQKKDLIKNKIILNKNIYKLI